MFFRPCAQVELLRTYDNHCGPLRSHLPQEQHITNIAVPLLVMLLGTMTSYWLAPFATVVPISPDVQLHAYLMVPHLTVISLQTLYAFLSAIGR